jgi:nucleotide-binding universal stress UspA family protein
MSTVELARPVVACVDGSSSALQATRWAAAQAARRELPLHIVHVVSRPLSAYAKEIAVDAELQVSLTARSRTILAEAHTAAEQAAPGVRATTTSIPGTVAPTLVDWSRGAELIVLGSRGLGGFGVLVAGSVAISLAAHAWCPVAVVRGESDESAGPVVVGVDASPAAAAAIALAFEEAELREAPLIAAHGWQQPAWESLHEPGYARDQVGALDAEAWDMVNEQLEPWIEKYPGIKVTRVVRRSGAAALLVGESATAQLVVVGSRGYGALGGLALGSTSQQLLRHGGCPLIVVRADQSPSWAGKPSKETT